MVNVKIKKLHPAAIIPQYATDGAACFDLHAIDVPGGAATIYRTCVFSTGLSFEIPHGYVMLVFSRSGHGFKNDTRLANCVGVIDSDYRGEVKVKLAADDLCGLPLVVKERDRIAQAMLVPYPRISFVESDCLTQTERGAGGFGSTGQAVIASAVERGRG